MSGDDDFQIKPALASDLDEVLALLVQSELPTDGVVEHLPTFLIARSLDNRMVGCVGVENYGAFGLLRSVAVVKDLRQLGLGSRLVSVALRDARANGIQEVVLLTTTARDFFARQFGFAETTRTKYEEHFAASNEWRLPRCSSAVVMVLDLSSDG